MINYKDLEVGHYVYIFDPTGLTSESTFQSTNNYIFEIQLPSYSPKMVIGINSQIITIEHNSNYYDFEHKNIYPVPLNLRLLEELGFVDCGPDPVYDFKIYTLGEDFNIFVFEDGTMRNENFDIDIKTLHWLQKIYYVWNASVKDTNGILRFG